MVRSRGRLSKVLQVASITTKGLIDVVDMGQ
jgi:hypothetical protein